jgi:hypothetical protein
MEINHEIDRILFDRSYKNGYVPPPTQKMLVISDRLTGTLNNIVCFSGLPKSGKSSFLSAAIASAFVPYSIFGIATHLPPKRKGLLLMDTESSEDDFYRQIGRIKKQIGKDEMPKTFHAFMLRDRTAIEIKEYTEYYLQLHPEISICYVDGMLDLLMNYNDERESKGTIDWLKRITAQYKILLVGVVHTGKKDNHTLGHFGSMIDRYCQSVLVVEKDEKQVPTLHTLKSKLMRSDANIEPITLLNNNGYFEQVF